MTNDECSIDCWITHSILTRKIYFTSLLMRKAFIATIVRSSDLIKVSGRATLVLPNEILLQIKNALYFPKSERYILSIKDIRLDRYHLETVDKRKEYLYITQVVSCQKRVLENIFCIS